MSCVVIILSVDNEKIIEYHPELCVCVWVTLSGIPFPVAIVKLEKLFDS